LRHDSISIADLGRHGIVIGVPFITLMAVIFLGTPLFEGNDDAGLAMIGAGYGLAAEPEPHLIFSHFGYGLFLSFVSRFAGPYAHGWASLAALGLAIGLYSRAVCEHLRGHGALVGAVLVMAVGFVFARALLELQFTITAALLFAAAMSCWLTVLREGARSPALATVIYGALAISFMIRPSAAVLGLVVVGPVLVWLAWRGPANSRQPTRRLIITIAAIAMIIYLTDKASYAFSTEWRDSMEYNQLRSLFNDFFRIPWIPGAPEYQKVGWSANDYTMYINWYSFHPIYDYDNIKFLAQTLLLQAPLLVPSGVRNWLMAPWDSPILSALVVGQLLLCVLLRHQRMFPFLLLIGTFAAITASGLTGRPPVFRVLFPAIGIGLLCTLPLLLAKEVKLVLLQKIGIGILLTIGLYAGLMTVQAHRERLADAAAYRAAISKAKPYFSGTVVSWGAGLAWEWLVTPTTVHSPLAGLTIASIGAISKTPITRSTLRRLGIADLSSTLCTQSDIRLIAYASQIVMLQTFCEEHYHVRPAYDLVFDSPRTQIFVSAQPELQQ
jgi:hypothetical protein